MMSRRNWFSRVFQTLSRTWKRSTGLPGWDRHSPERLFRLRLVLEELERRDAPAVFTVANVLDSGAGSLRQAMLDANALAGADTINFTIGAGGVQRIDITSDTL